MDKDQVIRVNALELALKYLATRSVGKSASRDVGYEATQVAEMFYGFLTAGEAKNKVPIANDHARLSPT